MKVVKTCFLGARFIFCFQAQQCISLPQVTACIVAKISTAENHMTGHFQYNSINILTGSK